MRLFTRKRDDDEVEERCPQCGEPVPEGDVECVMCGADLRPLREVPSDGGGCDSQSRLPWLSAIVTVTPRCTRGSTTHSLPKPRDLPVNAGKPT